MANIITITINDKNIKILRRKINDKQKIFPKLNIFIKCHIIYYIFYYIFVMFILFII